MQGRNKFIIGAITGASALIASMPFIVQMSSAASSSTSSAVTRQSSSISAPASDTDKEVPDAQEAAANEAKGQPEVKDVNDQSYTTEKNDPTDQKDQNEQDGSGAVEGGAASQD